MIKRTLLACIIGISFPLWTYATEMKQPSADASILGTWLIDREHSGSLGAFELVMRKIGDATIPETSLVITTNSIIHRYKKQPSAAFAVAGQEGMTIPLLKDRAGTEYYTIEYRYTANTNVIPHEIELTWIRGGKEFASKGIFKLEKASLWLSISIMGEAERPRDFKRAAVGLSPSVLKATKLK
jgi:hypothetical protein